MKGRKERGGGWERGRGKKRKGEREGEGRRREEGGSREMVEQGGSGRGTGSDGGGKIEES